MGLRGRDRLKAMAATPQMEALDDALLVRGRRALGGFDLIFCSDGTFLLDGGAMFGVVPKTMWQKRMPADEDNRVLLGLNTLVVRTCSAVVVMETGLGNKLEPSCGSLCRIRSGCRSRWRRRVCAWMR
jgi:hypothetical protein